MKHRPAHGFSLVEMAIVLVIVGLLLGGMLMPLSAQMEQRRISETKKAMDEITQALIGFAVVNGRLPCPADPTLARGTLNAGREDFSGTICNRFVGALPWADLGVNETDAWGWRFTYRVTASFGDAISQNTFTPPVSCTPTPTPTQSSFALCSQGDNTILATAGGATVASTIPAVIISHGKNGAGGYTITGTQIPLSADADEAENSNGDTTFVNKTPTDTYDDLTVWVSPNTLFNRMVSTSKLP